MLQSSFFLALDDNQREKSIRKSAHPEAEKPEEQHHNAQHAHTNSFCLHALAL
jgi:hypothetical protein